MSMKDNSLIFIKMKELHNRIIIDMGKINRFLRKPSCYVEC